MFLRNQQRHFVGVFLIRRLGVRVPPGALKREGTFWMPGVTDRQAAPSAQTIRRRLSYARLPPACCSLGLVLRATIEPACGRESGTHLGPRRLADHPFTVGSVLAEPPSELFRVGPKAIPS